jgi:hypothetical protein
LIAAQIPVEGPVGRVLVEAYEPKDRDRHDMAQVRATFGVDTHC